MLIKIAVHKNPNMNVGYLPEAEKNLERFSEEVEEEIRSRISELEQKAAEHPKVCLVDIKDRMLSRLKMDKGELNHRVVFDLINGEIYITNIFNRKESEYHELEPNLDID